jgi:6-phosphogluconolactonase
MATKVCIEPTAEQATDLVSQVVKAVICEAVGKRRTCYVALAGGTTPHALYRSLAVTGTGGEVPWTDCEIFFGDERDVPLDHVESNYLMAQRTLLDNLPIEPGRVHPMRGDARDLAAAAQEYEAVVRRIVPSEANKIPRFDIILLGMGGDGHTASLFPGTSALGEKDKLVVANFVPVLNRTRLTFTFPLINAARNVVLLVTGDDKIEAVSKLVSGGDIPAARVTVPNGLLTMVFDSAAARRINAQA